MNHYTLPLAVWLTTRYGKVRERARTVWDGLGDDDGLEDVAKLIYISVGVVLALTAAGIAFKVFANARDRIPDPVLPANPGS